jgi:hypothetical protein
LRKRERQDNIFTVLNGNEIIKILREAKQGNCKTTRQERDIQESKLIVTNAQTSLRSAGERVDKKCWGEWGEVGRRVV